MDLDEWQAWFRAQCENKGEKNAVSEQSAEAILRDVRAQSAARAGEVPGHEQGKDARLRVNLGERLAAAKERFIKK